MFEYTEKEAEVAAKAYAKFNAAEPLVTASLLALLDIKSVQEKWVKKNLPVEMPVEIVDKVLGNPEAVKALTGFAGLFLLGEATRKDLWEFTGLPWEYLEFLKTISRDIRAASWLSTLAVQRRDPKVIELVHESLISNTLPSLPDVSLDEVDGRG